MFGILREKHDTNKYLYYFRNSTNSQHPFQAQSALIRILCIEYEINPNVLNCSLYNTIKIWVLKQVDASYQYFTSIFQSMSISAQKPQ